MVRWVQTITVNIQLVSESGHLPSKHTKFQTFKTTTEKEEEAQNKENSNESHPAA